MVAAIQDAAVQVRTVDCATCARAAVVQCGRRMRRSSVMLESEAWQPDGDTVAGTWAPAIGDTALSSLERLIRSAAFAADCESAVFVTVSDGVATVGALFDAGGCLPLSAAWWLSADALIPPEGVLVIEDLAAAGPSLGCGGAVRGCAARLRCGWRHLRRAAGGRPAAPSRPQPGANLRAEHAWPATERLQAGPGACRSRKRPARSIQHRAAAFAGVRRGACQRRRADHGSRAD